MNVVQAKSILMLANKIKVQDKVKTPTIVQSPHQLYSPGSGLSMKRSLQRFLHKRKNRVQEASPYHHWQNQFFLYFLGNANLCF